ncbi:hypothetical protein GCM10022217_26220 [Chryseobacterium ginsenosidimutans]
MPVVAQNTASVSGNWNNCATWGNPTTIFNNTTDTKTINNGVAVTQNTAWSTNNVVLNGTGGITFASSGNSIDLVNDTGNDQSCVLPNCPTPSNLIVSGITNTGAPISNPGIVPQLGNVVFNLSGNNISSATWVVTPTTGVFPVTSGSGTSTGNIRFTVAGTYNIIFTASSTGSCTTTTATATAIETAVDPISCNPPFITSDLTGQGDFSSGESKTFSITATGGVRGIYYAINRTYPPSNQAFTGDLIKSGNTYSVTLSRSSFPSSSGTIPASLYFVIFKDATNVCPQPSVLINFNVAP